MLETDTAPSQCQFTLGGMLLWLTLVTMVLGLCVAVAEVYTQAGLNQISGPIFWSICLTSSGMFGSFLFCTIAFAARWFQGRPMVLEPGTVLLLAVAMVRFPEVLWAISRLVVAPSGEMEDVIFQTQYLLRAVQIASYLGTILLLWACWRFRESRTWVIVLGVYAVMPLVIRRISYLSSQSSWVFLVESDLRMVILLLLVFGAVIFDMVFRRRWTVLHWLGVSGVLLFTLEGFLIRFAL